MRYRPFPGPDARRNRSAVRGVQDLHGVLKVIALLAVWSACASSFFFLIGNTLYYGDAESHLNIARRLTDSRTPGTDQIGTVWLPLPHLLMAPLAANDRLWNSGLAGVIPSVVCFVIAGSFLFAAARRVFASDAAGAVAV